MSLPPLYLRVDPARVHGSIVIQAKVYQISPEKQGVSTEQRENRGAGQESGRFPAVGNRPVFCQQKCHVPSLTARLGISARGPGTAHMRKTSCAAYLCSLSWRVRGA